MIQAGNTNEVKAASGEWAFVDMGFAREARSCGLLIGNDSDTNNPDAEELTFSDLLSRISTLTSQSSRRQLNLLIEAPLSVAFDAHGNPTGRTVERRGSRTRYWYVGLGCTVLVATTYLLRHVVDVGTRREVHLFEGFVSFKPKGVRSSHSGDVKRLREIAWDSRRDSDAVVPPEALRLNTDDVLESAFKVAGMDFGVPPVVRVDV